MYRRFSISGCPLAWPLVFAGRGRQEKGQEYRQGEQKEEKEQPSRNSLPFSSLLSWSSNSNRRPTTLFTSVRYLSSSTLQEEEGKDEKKLETPTMKREEFNNLFNSRSIAERAAAMMMAQHHLHDSLMLKTFIEKMPKVSRDDIFQRGIPIEKWVQDSVLLQLVEDSNGVCRVNLSVDAERFLGEEVGSVKNQKRKSEGNNENVGTLSEVDLSTIVEMEQLLRILHYDVLGERKSGETNYRALNEAFSSLVREASRNPILRNVVNKLKYLEFLAMLNTPIGLEKFWVLNEKYICSRLPDETQPPRFVSPQPKATVANAMNAFGGWGAASNVPTRQDVYEILKYVPLNWGNFGNINIPAAIKKKHIRISSTLQWFRRQPFYFELRNIAGTTEIRRSVLLHPEHHGLTPEEAHEQLQLKIARGEANSLAPINAEGELVTVSDTSQHTTTILKFITRVCPGYFVTPSLLMQRYTKKNLTVGELVACARGRSDQFEELKIKYTDTTLLRKRTGADSSRWKDGFVEDFERYPEDVRGLIIIMGRICSTWDRPHYVYVRLSEEEKVLVGGFDGMMQIVKRHPQVFRVGESFIARVDLSDPLALREPEPSPGDMTTHVVIREENPYQTPRDLAVVFHYVAPDDEPCTAAYFLQCASPAMRAVLPPRLITLLQQFPDLFICKETSPGVFLMRKAKKNMRRLTNIFEDEPSKGGKGSNEKTLSSSSSSSSTSSSSFDFSQEKPDGDGNSEETLDLEAEFAESDFLSREEVIQAVKALIPPDGVEASQLLLWASISVQQAANSHYGGVLKLVEANRKHFRVQETQETKKIFPAEG
ncbi:hypothetical protein LSM04_007059 [Trypanosoma melophagium]|uniref:uncharacterized protein n=1 Tax=Trypanosoma melophagium TaxID=715481 RepID=UPI003519F810|nr:hypothetical protein LSM04_007059 [Trypanosoma melophagium]